MYDIQGAKPEAIVKLKDAMEKAEGGYFNGILTKVNDHVVRIKHNDRTLLLASAL